MQMVEGQLHLEICRVERWMDLIGYGFSEEKTWPSISAGVEHTPTPTSFLLVIVLKW